MTAADDLSAPHILEVQYIIEAVHTKVKFRPKELLGRYCGCAGRLNKATRDQDAAEQSRHNLRRYG
jgi:hypothetical protein